MTARGNVVLRRQDQSVRADTVTWNSESGQILASGNVRVVDDDGNQFFTDSVELTDEFETGNMQNVLLALREGGRLAARSGRRDEQGNVIITDAVYSACEIETRSGCPKTPSWRIVAKQVAYVPDENIVRFGGARSARLNQRAVVSALAGLLVGPAGDRHYTESKDAMGQCVAHSAARACAAGSAGWKYSEDSLWMNMAAGCARRIASSASRLAFARFFSAVTKPRSEESRSFHHPYWPENVAVTKISLTGV